jgi:hypothetical protein
MTEAPKAHTTFITYTKGAIQFVTAPGYETSFLNWLNSCSDSSGYTRETMDLVAVRCSPVVVHAVEKREATILTLVKKDEAES